LALILPSCSIHNKRKLESISYHLNGENYRKAKIRNLVLSDVEIPIGLKEKKTTIQGTVFVKGLSPVKFETLLLTQDSKTILQTTINIDGSFKFEGVVPNGDYSIILDSTQYYLKKDITVGNYNIEGLELKVNQ
jgi:hypothetical protein